MSFKYEMADKNDTGSTSRVVIIRSKAIENVITRTSTSISRNFIDKINKAIFAVMSNNGFRVNRLLPARPVIFGRLVSTG